MIIDKHKTPFFVKRFSASATIEGALVIPIFIYAVVAITYMLQIIAIRTKVNNCLYNSIRKFAGYAYVCEEIKGLSEEDKKDVKDNYDDSGILYAGLTDAAFLAVFINEIGHDFAKNNNIVGQNAGWIIAESSILKNESRIEITMRYSVKNPFDIFGIGNIVVSEKKVMNAWLGEKEKEKETVSENKKDKDRIVYITTNGTVYHTNKECTYLSRNISSCDSDKINSLRNLDGGKYYPCSVCNKSSDGGVVYYTDYGDRYHGLSYCRELTRAILSVPLSSVSNRRLCKKCAS